ncbi:alpha/beta hydrolase family protein, partial [Micromonospora azadirachtae]
PVADLAEAYRLDLDGGAVAELLGGGPSEVPDRYRAADPRTSVPIRSRIVVIHGEMDQQVPAAMSRDFVAAARTAGSDIAHYELPECEHFGLIDPESAAWPVVVAALRSLHEDQRPIDAASPTR